MRETARVSRFIFIPILAAAAVLAGASGALFGVCGPFTDVAADAFCPFVQEVFYLGITTGTSPTTYDPTSPVSRLQMAAFLSRSVDSVVKRGSRRAAVNQFWTPQNATRLGLTTVGGPPRQVASDGHGVWTADGSGNSVSHVDGGTGKLLESWTGATVASGILVAMGRVFASGLLGPGRLYRIDPSQPAGGVTTVASTLGNFPEQIAFDGFLIWSANFLGPSVSIATPGDTIPWTVTTVTTGFQGPTGILFDGSNVWITDFTAGTLLKLDGSGAILQTVTVGAFPLYPVFDGTSIWVPNSFAASVSVVRASTGAVLATLTGNGLNGPTAAAFDGQRVLVTNATGASVSLWKAADLTPLGFFGTGTGSQPYGACSDGLSFWIAFNGSGHLARF